MKILLLNPAGAMGGAERVLLDVAAGVRALNPRHEFALIAAADGALVEEARSRGIPSSVMPFPPVLARLGDAGAGGPAGVAAGRWRTLGRLGLSSPAAVRYTRSLARAIAGLAPDVVHANGFKMHLLAARATPEATPLLWHLHDYPSSRPLMPILLKLHARRVAAIVANSRSVAADARAVLGASVPIHTVHNGVDLERFAPHGAVADLDALANLPTDDRAVVRVGLVAATARWKGQDQFLRALALLPPQMTVRGYVIGGPIYQTAGSQFTLTELRALAVTLGLAGKVGFTGYLREVAPALRALDIVVHASVAPEPFGLVIAEAFACGRAVITSATGGAADLVTAESDALVYRAADVQALAAAIARLAANPALRAALGGAGRVTAEQRFDRARMAAQLNTIYQGLVSAESDDALAARS
ncbi:MAG TPA: glycosyltransferase [Candidatus Binataceae bacterium]|nr:glycosyltransferase [Candidatus Binataceae bacterium]